MSNAGAELSKLIGTDLSSSFQMDYYIDCHLVISLLFDTLSIYMWNENENSELLRIIKKLDL